MSKLNNVLAQLQTDHASPGECRAEVLAGIGRLQRALAKFQDSESPSAIEQTSPPAAITSPRAGTEAAVQYTIRVRAERSDFLPAELFADPAWDMLLELYLADILSTQISVSRICARSNVPMATALRWLDKLKQKGLIVRSKDALDARRIFISLSKDGLERMDGYFENLAATRLVDRGQHP